MFYPDESNKVLFGKRILITRPKEQSEIFARALADLGAQVEELPLIQISPPDSWENFDSAIKRLENYAWLIFASTNAVESSIKRIRFLQLENKLHKIAIATIGPSTAAALQTLGFESELTPSKAVAESLVQEFPEAPSSQSRSSRNVLWSKTNIGRMVIREALESKGWIVDVVNSYRTEGPKDPQATAQSLYALLHDRKLDAITITSSETAKQLHELVKLLGTSQVEIESLMENVKLCVLGPETAKTCETLFGRVDLQPEKYTISALVEKLAQCL